MRLHAPTKATTLGVGGVLAASLLYFLGSGRLVVHELLIALFLFVTAPVSALMLARAAIRSACRRGRSCRRKKKTGPRPGLGMDPGVRRGRRALTRRHFFAAGGAAAAGVAAAGFFSGK